MMAFKSLWNRRWLSTDTYKPPEKDEHVMVADSLLSELEFHIRDIDKRNRDKEDEDKRRTTGVDYSWLVSVTPKTYEVPQLERLELEELCYKVSSTECGKIISLFRDAVLRERPVRELPGVMRSCVLQVIEQRPREETLSEWVTKRTMSLTSLKLRPNPKVAPSSGIEDVEMQEGVPRETRAMSMPDFSVERSTTCTMRF
ncbi:protein RD3-like [Haliotis rubra]|uniref:protein RD3-like n=1 Tax=Haliotis rubra TaxID=36100 RepID=UPI001EE61867|nr:protein RD3-like [Haliotis rubra]XP_046556559.1 protein RD3-like [Haliotis rubra]XP_046556560.1 protein RD3-like [Haliotis rubra]XP_046556561.1 protein RD3-like [Haliotis rubra]XP_046556562.1 protein RD3-like [Haliotis rubra]XP_046556563.1 protein RD3-like [Haliotis rubra]XP_046556564.1 protein RD3-like [Haliotis rubra]XP_046556565.1 protein RD3-like [Haliotis rubra]XP_046556566.1 protein RD3-like [Haliotis rubra]XP_046556567.1 protein RD3-like [Haliotis rubra]XP_046556568.1 protein RD